MPRHTVCEASGSCSGGAMCLGAAQRAAVLVALALCLAPGTVGGSDGQPSGWTAAAPAASKQGLILCSELPELQGLPNRPKVHGWCRPNSPGGTVSTLSVESATSSPGAAFSIAGSDATGGSSSTGSSASARERWITLWREDAGQLSGKACQEGESPMEGRYNGSCVWQYGKLINGFAGDFTRQQLRKFVAAWGDKMDSLSRDSRVSIYSSEGGPTPPSWPESSGSSSSSSDGSNGGSPVGAALSSFNAVSSSLDATDITTSDPITDHVRQELQDGVQKLSTYGSAAGSADSVPSSSNSSDGSVSMSSVQSARWGLDRIDQPNLPLDGLYHFYNTGSKVNIYVVDTGIRLTHQEFGYLDGRPGSRADEVYTTLSQSDAGTDCEGHGTHVAAAAGGLTFGVAKNVTLHAVRILDCNGDGSVSDVIQALSWLRDNAKRPAVATMSLGGDVQPALDQAVRSLAAANVSVVVAAGNGDVNACNISPAREPSAVTVGATDSSDHRLWIAKGVGSNYGPCIDVFAPGKDIVSASNTADNAQEMRTGTSQGVPFVAGTLALMMQNLTASRPDDLQRLLASSAVQGVISETPGSGRSTLSATSSPNLLLQSTLRAPIVVAPASLRITNASTTSYSFQVQLGQLPGSNVNVEISVDAKLRGKVGPTLMQFTAASWNTPQSLTLTTTPLASPDSSPLVISFRTQSPDALYKNMAAYVSLPDMKGDTLQYPKVVPQIPFSEKGDTSQYTDDYDVVCSAADRDKGGGKDVVYYFEPSQDVTLVASLCPSAALKDTFDTRLYLIEDVDGGGKVSATACSNDKCGLLSEITASLKAGTGYAIVVDGAGGDSGPYNLTLSAVDGSTVKGGLPPAPMLTASFSVAGVADSSTPLAGATTPTVATSTATERDSTSAAGGTASATVTASFINRTLPSSSTVQAVPGTNLAWVTGAWGVCLSDCLQTRPVSCLDPNGLVQLDALCEAGLAKPNGTQPCSGGCGGGMSTNTIAIIAGCSAGAVLAIALAVAAWVFLRRRPRQQQVAPDAGGKGGSVAKGGDMVPSGGSDAAKHAAAAATQQQQQQQDLRASAFSCPSLGGRYRLVDPATGLPREMTPAELAAAASGAPALPPVVVHMPDHRLRGEDTGTPTGRRSLRQRSPTRRGPSHLNPAAAVTEQAVHQGPHGPEHRVAIADSRGSTPRTPHYYP